MSAEDVTNAVGDEVDAVRRPEREMLPAILGKLGLSKASLFDRKRVAAVLDARLVRKKREQANWPATTDCDRLDDAIATLRDRGFLVLAIDGDRHFGYANAEAVLEHQRATGKAVRALAWFHPDEDVWKAVNVGTLPMLVIVPDQKSQVKYEETANAARNELVAAFGDHGFKAYLTGLGNLTVAIDMKGRRRLDRPLPVVRGATQ